MQAGDHGRSGRSLIDVHFQPADAIPARTSLSACRRPRDGDPNATQLESVVCVAMALCVVWVKWLRGMRYNLRLLEG